MTWKRTLSGGWQTMRAGLVINVERRSHRDWVASTTTVDGELITDYASTREKAARDLVDWVEYLQVHKGRRV